MLILLLPVIQVQIRLLTSLVANDDFIYFWCSPGIFPAIINELADVLSNFHFLIINNRRLVRTEISDWIFYIMGEWMLCYVSRDQLCMAPKTRVLTEKLSATRKARKIWFYGDVVTFKVIGEEIGGKYPVWEIEVPAQGDSDHPPVY